MCLAFCVLLLTSLLLGKYDPSDESSRITYFILVCLGPVSNAESLLDTLYTAIETADLDDLSKICFIPVDVLPLLNTLI